MTDNEIIKALECCSHRNEDLPCDGCPAYNIAQMCMEDLMSAALDLINRQKAEIERLKQIIDKQDKEIIKLQKRIIFWREDLNYQPEKIKSEALEEFAEELKHFIIPQKADGYTREIVLKRDIDNLVKEMTEVDK